jgi:hypothetical protein
MTKKSILAKLQGLPENVFSENITLIPVDKVYQAMDEYAEYVAKEAWKMGKGYPLHEYVYFIDWYKEFKASDNDG